MNTWKLLKNLLPPTKRQTTKRTTPNLSTLPRSAGEDRRCFAVSICSSRNSSLENRKYPTANLNKNAERLTMNLQQKGSANSNKSVSDLDFNSELCSICKEHECVKAYLAELEHAHFGGAAAQNPTTDINDSSQVLASSPVKAVDSPKSTKLSDLVCCEGLCLRSFHIGCLAEDVQEDILNENNSSKKWLCDDAKWIF